MRERVRDRAAHLREVAAAHDTAADSLERHLSEVDVLKDAIAQIRAQGRAARGRRARPASRGSTTPTTPPASTAPPTPRTSALAAFTPPPSGHKDWLTVNLPGL